VEAAKELLDEGVIIRPECCTLESQSPPLHPQERFEPRPARGPQPRSSPMYTAVQDGVYVRQSSDGLTKTSGDAPFNLPLFLISQKEKYLPVTRLSHCINTPVQLDPAPAVQE